MPKLMRSIALGALIGGGALLIVMVLRAVVLSFEFTQPPSSALNPPTYPNAQNVKAEDSGSAQTDRRITFETPDKPEAVLAFYEERLLKEGWYNPPACPHRVACYEVAKNVFEWRQTGPEGPAALAYRLKICFAVTTTRTVVTIELVQFNPLDPHFEKPPFEGNLEC
jgi:hypothetical protein